MEEICSSEMVLDSYHESLARDPHARERRSLLHEQRLVRTAFARSPAYGIGQVDGGSVTWAMLEEQVQAEVSWLRAMLGAKPIQSSTLQSRLRTRCASHGALSFATQRPHVSTDRETALVGGGQIVGEALAILSMRSPGLAAPRDVQGFAWVYRFETAEVAEAHLVSHPCFGAGAASPSALGARVALVVTVPASSAGFRARFVVLACVWRNASREDDLLPVGSDLLSFARARKEAHLGSPLCQSVSKLRDAAFKVSGAGRRGGKDAAGAAFAELMSAIDVVCNTSVSQPGSSVSTASSRRSPDSDAIGSEKDRLVPHAHAAELGSVSSPSSPRAVDHDDASPSSSLPLSADTFTPPMDDCWREHRGRSAHNR